MPIRGGGLRGNTWPLRRMKEWSRYLGASPSMRIIASWFGSCRPTAYKYASVITRRKAGSPRNQHIGEIRLTLPERFLVTESDPKRFVRKGKDVCDALTP